jgi:hypothetical protein
MRALHRPAVMDTVDQLRIPGALGYRIDLEQVRARLDVLVRSLAADARSLDRAAARRLRESASQLAYLARLQEQALARNGRAFQ